MKKKILFVMNNLSSGGAEKSLSSLLETIDYSEYEVDLLLFKPEGLFFRKLPEQINLLKEPVEYQFFDMPIKTAIADCVKQGRLDIAMARVCASYIFRTEKNKARCEQKVWKYVAKPMGKIDKTYDVAIGYLEKSSIYFVVDKVKSKRKIGWIHTNYTNSGMDQNLDNPYFQQLNHIVTVSEECAQSIKLKFPQLTDKVKIIGNIVSPAIINTLSNNEIQDGLVYDNSYINIITVARLGYEKGIDMAIEACGLLVENGCKVRWYVLGYGTEKEKRESSNLIESKGLENHFQLLGVKENPYPYIKGADIYVQPSRYEGKSIAIDEAKILKKPIVVTNFNTAKDQIEDCKTGLIVEMGAQSIATGIKKLMSNEGLRNKLIDNLSKEKLGTESEIQKLYGLLF